MKKLLRPHNANNQSNIAPPSYTPIIANGPRAKTRASVARGRPFLSMYAKIFGAWPISANASRVRDAAKVEALPTDNTDTKMTALMTCAKGGSLAASMARTKGEALTSPG